METAVTPVTDYRKEFNELIGITVAENASDLHLSPGYHPTIRVSGTLLPLAKKNPLANKDIDEFLKAILTKEQLDRFSREQELDFSYSHTDGNRFRGNAALQRGLTIITFRLIPKALRTIAELGLPPVLETFAQKRHGI